MSLSRFHPLVREWFSSTFGQPTPAQARGWAAIRDGRHTLIAAPTGSGKTLAAFLTALDGLTREGLAAPLADEVRVRLRLAAEGAQRRHPQEPGGAAARHRTAGRRRRDRRAAHHGGRAHGRHAGVGTRRDAAHAAAHPGHDARIAVPAADRRAQPRDAADRADGHRRRNPRRHRHAPRRASRAVARAPQPGRRRPAAADRPVGDAEADRGGRALSGRPATRRVRDRRRRPSPRDGPRRSRCPARRSTR